MASVIEPSPAPAPRRARIAGQRLIVMLLAGAVVVAAIVILVGLIVVRGAGESEAACADQPAVCAVVRDYVDAINDRDAGRVLALVTDNGLRNLLKVSSGEELEERLATLSSVDQITSVRITSVSVQDSTATALAQLQREDQDTESPLVLRLVWRDGRWLVDR